MWNLGYQNIKQMPAYIYVETELYWQWPILCSVINWETLFYVRVLCRLMYANDFNSWVLPSKADISVEFDLYRAQCSCEPLADALLSQLLLQFRFRVVPLLLRHTTRF